MGFCSFNYLTRRGLSVKSQPCMNQFFKNTRTHPMRDFIFTKQNPRRRTAIPAASSLPHRAAAVIRPYLHISDDLDCFSFLLVRVHSHHRSCCRKFLCTGDSKSSILSGDFLPSPFSDEQQALGRFLSAAPSVPSSATFTALGHSLLAHRQPVFRLPSSSVFRRAFLHPVFPVSFLSICFFLEGRAVRNQIVADLLLQSLFSLVVCFVHIFRSCCGISDDPHCHRPPRPWWQRVLAL